MKDEISKLATSARGRVVATLTVTVSVAVIFGLLALTNPYLGGHSHAPATIVGAGIFFIFSILLYRRLQRTDPQQQVRVLPSNARFAVLVIALVLFLLAALMWFFSFAGIQLRFGLDPVFLAVPLSIYPFLALWGAKPTQPHTIKDKQ